MRCEHLSCWTPASKTESDEFLATHKVGHLVTAIEKTKAVCERLQEQTVAAAKVTDKAVREHPYHAAGIAFGVGLLIGVLAMRCRHD